MVPGIEVKNVEALKGLQGTEFETLLRIFGLCCRHKPSEYAIPVVRLGLF
jgi:hypothetical protein